MMTKLKGQFSLMALMTEGKGLMVGCHDYPLAVGKMKNEETVYFCTDTKTWAASFSVNIFSPHESKTDDILWHTASIPY